MYTNITYTHTMTHKMINKEFGGKVEPLDIREDGVFSIDIEVNCPLFRLILHFSYKYICNEWFNCCIL